MSEQLTSEPEGVALYDSVPRIRAVVREWRDSIYQIFIDTTAWMSPVHERVLELSTLVQDEQMVAELLSLHSHYTGGENEVFSKTEIRKLKLEAAQFLLHLYWQVITKNIEEHEANSVIQDLEKGIEEKLSVLRQLLIEFQEGEVDDQSYEQHFGFIFTEDVDHLISQYLLLLDACPTQIATRRAQLSRPQVRKLVADKVLFGGKRGGNKIFVSLLELNDYLKRDRGSIPSAITDEHGIEYLAVSVASQEFAFTPQWIYQLVKKGLIGSIEGKDGLYVRRQDLILYREGN